MHLLRNLSLAITAAAATTSALHAGAPAAERVYVMTNNAAKNEVLAFERTGNGRFHSLGQYSTGGRGSGGSTDPLESQGSLAFNYDHTLLFAVNAGSGTVSSFLVADGRLILADQAPTGGAEPVSVTQRGQFTYVLNQGAYGGVTVFHVDASGRLRHVPHSTVPLAATGAGASSVAVSPDGAFLAVVERLTNNIDTFRIFPDGTLSAFTTTPSKNPGAFSAIFTEAGQLLVAETGPANAASASTFSSYSLGGNGAITAVSSAVPTYAGGNCWAALTPDGKRVYTSNSASDSVSGFNVAGNGALTPIGNTVVGTLPAGSHNVDIAVSADGKLVYTQNSDSGTIGVFAIQPDGALQEEEGISGLPKQAGFNGLAAF